MTHLQAQHRRRNMEPYLRAGDSYKSIGERFGTSIMVVSQAARELGISRKQGQGLRKDKYARFAAVDWRRQDMEIAQQIGCTRERVRQVRNKLGKGKSPNHKSNIRSAKATAWLRENLMTMRERKASEIQRLSPVKLSQSAWLRVMRRCGVDPTRSSVANRITSREALREMCNVTAAGCWEWKGSCNPISGYAQVSSKHRLGHRFSYEKFIGEIPSGLCVMHSCDNPPCMNPDHLFIGTDQDNADDSVAKGRRTCRRLPMDVVREIRAAAESSNNYYEIGKQFGISGITAWNIAKRKTYQNVA